jgi:hypothetical protein
MDEGYECRLIYKGEQLMRSAVFYLLHSTAIIGLMIASYAYGFKQAASNAKDKAFSFIKRN